MRPSRRAAKRTYNPVESSDDDDDKPQKKSPKQLNNLNLSEDSSSDSDIENYLQTPSKLDFDSSFFNPQKTNEEEKVSFDIGSLSDSDEESNGDNKPLEKEVQHATTMDFEHINTYNKKLEEARKFIEDYKAKKAAEQKPDEISDILKLGEGISEEEEFYNSLGSANFETTSDSEDWEVVEEKEDKTEERRGVEITINDPSNVKKKKGVDLMAMVKRKINRVKKENQVYIHKVHLLTWIAHGLLVNNILNDENMLGLGLSLLPSQHCLPKSRLDITYLENILSWYRKMMRNKNLPVSQIPENNLIKSLEEQILNKEVYNHKFLVYIFVIILRSLGFDCRVVLSLQVEPLRPPATELLSLSNKKEQPKPDEKICTPKTPRTVKVLSSKLNSSKLPDKLLGSVKKLKDKLNLSSSGKFSGPSTSKNAKNTSTTSETKTGKTRATNKLEKGNNEKTKVSKDLSNTKLKQTGKEEIVKDVEKKATRKSSTKAKEDTKSSHKKEEKSPQKKNESKNKSKKTETEEQSLKTKANNKDNSKQEVHDNTRRNPSKTSEEIRKETKKTTKSKDTKKLPDMDSETSPSKNKADKIKAKNKRIETSENESVGKLQETETKNKRISLKAKPDESKKDKLEVKEIIETSQSKETTQDVVENRTKKATKSEKATTTKKSKDKPNLKLKEQLPKFKIKIHPKKKSQQISEDPSESEDEIQRNFQPLVPKQEIIPKIEPVTPRKPSFSAEDGFLGFDESEQVAIPQFDGANDSDSSSKPSRSKPNPSKIKKPNLSKIKNVSPEKCTLKNHGTRMKPPQNYSEMDSDEDFLPKPNLPRKKLSSTNSSSDSERSRFFNTPKKLDVRNDILSLVQQSIDEEKLVKRRKLVKRKSSNDDEDYSPTEVEKKRQKVGDFKEKAPTKVKRRIPTRKELLELEEKKKAEREAKLKDKGVNVWIEVFAEAEEKWISVDVGKGQVHCVKEISKRATQPISYILAFNNTNHIKDITKRYCSTIWNTSTRRLRVDDKWWNSTLKPYKGPSTPRDKEEDEDLARLQLEQPLPTTISEYKNHPLYVLRRHLLKFEAIYPPDALTLGFVRNEPVYSRDCVYTLHSRDIWLKHAKVVKPGEEPYKIVKARPKYDKLSNTVVTDQLLEVFGKWQVEDYVPPTAENGVVPRNAYGNVDLFKACMLPKRTVHLQLPGLNKVAKKLNIDCAPAVTGFDFHSGWSHPTFDGFVVCEEFSEQLVAAWFEDQQEAEKRAQEKIEKRVYDNWRRLIRGLLIRERLKLKYDFGEPSTSAKPEKKDKNADKPSTSRSK